MLPAFLSTKYANISTLTQHTQIVVTNRLPNVLHPLFMCGLVNLEVNNAKNTHSR
jgi:hypothetical protein